MPGDERATSYSVDFVTSLIRGKRVVVQEQEKVNETVHRTVLVKSVKGHCYRCLGEKGSQQQSQKAST